MFIYLRLLLAASLCCWLDSIQAQTLKNGQVFTNGLAIFDSPAPNSVLHAGSSMSIAVDISGDGKLSQPGFSTAGFDSLDIFLVSSETNVNITVTSGPGFLAQEQGSTVKHLNWPIPTCVQPGSYNITLYEISHMASVQYFSITPITVTIQNNSPSSSCSSTNALFAQPQASSPFPENPLFEASTLTQSTGSNAPTSATATPVAPLTLVVPQDLTSTSAVASPTNPAPPVSSQNAVDALTVTVGPSGLQWPLTVSSPQETIPIIVGPSDYIPPGTVTVTANVISTALAGQPGAGDGAVTVVVTPTLTPTPVTVVLVSIGTETLTTTVSGQRSLYTTTETALSTTTALVGMQGINTIKPDYAGFLPINSAPASIHDLTRLARCALVCLHVFISLLLL